MTTHRQSYRARWLFPVDAAPIENGTIEIEAGFITAVHDRHDPRARDLGNVALIPGLVNAHTHLEFSDLAEPIGPPRPFTDWIRAVIAQRQQRRLSPADIVRAGLLESTANGCTWVGEIATGDWSSEVFTDQGGRGVLFRELIGFVPEQIDEQLAIARRHLEADPALSQPGIVRGISPHAPYSVHPELYHRLVQLAGEFRAPLAVHLAETEAELELLAQGTGEFRTMLADFGLWRDDTLPRCSSPLDYLHPLADLDRALVIHGNYLEKPEVDFLAEHPQLTVVFCPRTHAYFGHGEHPWKEMRARGVSLALGTDSRASNPDLSLWRELLWLYERHPDVPPADLLRLGTLDGARALGQNHQTGSLTAGKSSDLAVVALSRPAEGDPDFQLFTPGNRLVATMQQGRWVSGGSTYALG